MFTCCQAQPQIYRTQIGQELRSNKIDLSKIDLNAKDKRTLKAVDDMTADWDDIFYKYDFEDKQNSICLEDYLKNYNEDKYIALKVVYTKIKQQQTRAALEQFTNYFNIEQHNI